MSHIHLRVAELRRAKGWTQKELADRVGVSRQTVIRVEGEANRRLGYDVLEKLAEAFAVDAAYLIVCRSEKARTIGVVGLPAGANLTYTRYA